MRVTFPRAFSPRPHREILYRKHLGDRVLYHYVSRAPLLGSRPVTPTFEDAYVALLLQHGAHGSGRPSSAPLDEIRGTGLAQQF